MLFDEMVKISASDCGGNFPEAKGRINKCSGFITYSDLDSLIFNLQTPFTINDLNIDGGKGRILNAKRTKLLLKSPVKRIPKVKSAPRLSSMTTSDNDSDNEKKYPSKK
eukprot:UN28077